VEPIGSRGTSCTALNRAERTRTFLYFIRVHTRSCAFPGQLGAASWFTPKKSLVRSQYRPQETAGQRPASESETWPSACPMLTLHISAPAAGLSIDVTGSQAWALAGLLIDATVAHARATPHGRYPGANDDRERPSPRRSENTMRSRLASLRRRANHGGAQHGLTSIRRSFRCLPGSQRPRGDDCVTGT